MQRIASAGNWIKKKVLPVKVTPFLFVWFCILFFVAWFRRNGEAGPAFGSSSGKNFLAVHARHSLSETVLVFFLPIRWLERSFHFSNS